MFVVVASSRPLRSRAEPDVDVGDGDGGWQVTTEHDDPLEVVSLTLSCLRGGGGVVGVGAGRRRARALAQRAARGARTAPSRTQVRGERAAAAEHADAVLAVLADVLRRRTKPGWAVVDALRAGRSQEDVAELLGVTRQAVSQRALVAGWRHEQRLSPLAAELLVASLGPGRPGV